MALFFIALTPIQKDTEINPRVTWVFSEKSCFSCVEKQLEIMKEFLQPQDRIILQNANWSWIGKSEPGKIEALIHDHFPDWVERLIKENIEGHQIRTGWLWTDPVTGEMITFSGSPGNYGALKSRALLSVLR